MRMFYWPLVFMIPAYMLQKETGMLFLMPASLGNGAGEPVAPSVFSPYFKPTR